MKEIDDIVRLYEDITDVDHKYLIFGEDPNAVALIPVGYFEEPDSELYTIRYIKADHQLSKKYQSSYANDYSMIVSFIKDNYSDDKNYHLVFISNLRGGSTEDLIVLQVWVQKGKISREDYPAIKHRPQYDDQDGVRTVKRSKWKDGKMYYREIAEYRPNSDEDFISEFDYFDGDGMVHNDDDDPAACSCDDDIITYYWCQHGELKREDDKPTKVEVYIGDDPHIETPHRKSWMVGILPDINGDSDRKPHEYWRQNGPAYMSTRTELYFFIDGKGPYSREEYTSEMAKTKIKDPNSTMMDVLCAFGDL